MKRKLLIGACLTALASTAIAQRPAMESELSTKETRRLMHEYARCVVKQQGAKASAALLGNTDNATILRRYPMLIIGECLRGRAFARMQMRFQGDLYRYALADALVNKELAASPVPDFAALPPLEHREPHPAPPALAPGAKKAALKSYEEELGHHKTSVAYRFLSTYGECIVRANPAGAKALLVTAPDSQDEAVRFGELRPAFGRCLPQGQTLTFGKVALRGSIAVNYYRLARAAQAAPARTPA